MTDSDAVRRVGLALPRTHEREVRGRWKLRVGQIAPVVALDRQELYYVRARSDVSLGGVNSWFARMTGEAEETPWVQSSLLTPVRNQ